MDLDNVLEMDTVLQYVRRTARKLRVPSDTAITQQILLFAESFYGYRFTTPDFMAIWSAADQILKVFDHNGRMLETISLSENTVGASIDSIPVIPQRRAA